MFSYSTEQLGIIAKFDNLESAMLCKHLNLFFNLKLVDFNDYIQFSCSCLTN